MSLYKRPHSELTEPDLVVENNLQLVGYDSQNIEVLI